MTAAAATLLIGKRKFYDPGFVKNFLCCRSNESRFRHGHGLKSLVSNALFGDDFSHPVSVILGNQYDR